MKILHISDLHLGKVVYEHSLLEDQKYILNQVIEELQKEDYRVLIIAGDIYDRSIPPTEAITLFDNFLTKIHNNFAHLHVCMIAGNHDSGTRLAFANSFLTQQNIHIAGTINDALKPILIKDKNDSVQFFLLPTLLSGSLKNQETGESIISQEALYKEAIALINKNLDTSIPAILVAHLFTLGGQSSTSERHFIGTVEEVTSSLFSNFSYVALGHLHKPQKVSDSIYYSGSPLAYSFDECEQEKNMLKIEITKTEKKITPIFFRPLHSVKSLTGTFNDFFISNRFDEYKNSYIEITFCDKEIVISPMQLLKQKFPFLLSIKQSEEALYKKNTSAENEYKKNSTSKIKETKSTKERITKDFENFLCDIYDLNSTEEVAEKTKLFSILSGEILNETDKN